MSCGEFPNCTSLAIQNTTEEKPPAIVPLISYYLHTLFFLVNGHITANALSLFGIFSNSVNLIVYIKMGLSETTNIKLFAMACVDLVICLCTIIMDLLFLLQEQRFPLAFKLVLAEGIVYMIIILYPSVGCGAMITAILSTERCLCIVMPLKVKKILTPTRTWLLVGTSAVYELLLLGLMFGLTGPPYNRPSRLRITLNVCAFTGPAIICFIIVSVSTAFLITRLRQNLTWRKSISSQSTENSTRELRACRFAVAICTIFIVCFFPNVLVYVAMLIGHPRMSMRDRYYGSFVRVLFTFTFVFQAISSSANIFVYYSMSSNYRATLKALFKRK